MSRNIKPTFVYHRRGQNRKSLALCAYPSDGSQSVISSETLSVAAKENMVSFFERINAAVNSPAGRIVESFTGAKVEFNVRPNGFSDIGCVNDNCSSSKSNLEPRSIAPRSECSYSGALKVPHEMSHMEICALVLRNQGVLGRIRPKNSDVSSDNYCSKACKACTRVDSTCNMLICDECTDAFHMPCCDPRVTRIPAGEWFCGSCLETKRKVLKEGINGDSAPEEELGSLEFMFTETEPYMSNVRIGDDFQADVPNWSGPVYNECDNWWLEMDPSSNNVSMQEQNYSNFVKQGSIGNWLQCREPIQGVGDGDQGNICGKWRRAPLFEIQSDKWVCFSCILWDPSRADCAVPQEINTEEVMKQLKYIEMLKPRLAAKRRKLNCSKSV